VLTGNGAAVPQGPAGTDLFPSDEGTPVAGSGHTTIPFESETTFQIACGLSGASGEAPSSGAIGSQSSVQTDEAAADTCGQNIAISSDAPD
jgi:hypothetical protein